jgi:riboflavin biosynthesis pyrimidine reductase
VSSPLTTPLVFSSSSDRPFFFTSYVTTIDGKIYVKRPGYWPIGSKTDFAYYTYLRAHADVIIEGKNTALQYGGATIKTLHSEKFLSYRNQLGKENVCDFIILSRTLDAQFASVLQNEFGYKPTIVTSSDNFSQKINKVANVEILKQTDSFISSLLMYLKKKKYQYVFLDVGPVLLSEFIKASAFDELFLTLSPKLFGRNEETISLGDHELFLPESIPTFSLVSSEKIDNEMFLRYSLLKKT